MSHRIAQIESTLKRQIAKVLATQLADPRIVGMISVTQVSVSPDMKQATVYVSVIPQQYESRTERGLNTAAGYIGSKVARQMTIRHMPRLQFKLDSTLKQQARVFDAIARGIERESDADESEPAGDLDASDSTSPPPSPKSESPS